MGEFDVDPQLQGAAGSGWEAHFRTPIPGGRVRMMNTGRRVHPCDPVAYPSRPGDISRGTGAPPAPVAAAR